MQAGSETRRRTLGWLAAAGGLGLASPVLASAPPPAHAIEPAADPLAEAPLDPDAGSTVVDTAGDVFDQVIAPVMINGQGPFRFMVDTGANASCVSAALAERLQLPFGRKVRVHTIVGPRERSTVLIDRLDLGDRSRKRVEAPVFAMSGFAIDGVLGVDWLKGQRLVFGFKGKSLEITKSRRETSREGRVVVPARRKSGQLTIIDADLSGESISAMIDSGSQFSIGNHALGALIERQDPTASRSAIPVAMITIAGERFHGRQLNLPFVRLGGLTMGNVPVVFTELPVFKLWDLHDKPTMMLGIDLLTQFHTVALDFGRSAVRFDIA